MTKWITYEPVPNLKNINYKHKTAHWNIIHGSWNCSITVLVMLWFRQLQDFFCLCHIFWQWVDSTFLCLCVVVVLGAYVQDAFLILWYLDHITQNTALEQLIWHLQAIFKISLSSLGLKSYLSKHLLTDTHTKVCEVCRIRTLRFTATLCYPLGSWKRLPFLDGQFGQRLNSSIYDRICSLCWGLEPAEN